MKCRLLAMTVHADRIDRLGVSEDRTVTDRAPCATTGREIEMEVKIRKDCNLPRCNGSTVSRDYCAGGVPRVRQRTVSGTDSTHL